ncbi:MAG: double-strand break repair protein AddB [Paracoccaceae bacterium]
MFDPTDRARLFGLAPGADFPKSLVEGVRARLGDAPPEALARVELIVNTRRMARRIRDIFDAGPPCLLPRVGLVTDLGDVADLAEIPPPVPPLRRRLELVQLVARLLKAQPDLAPRSALYDLADSLAALMDEMHGEGVSPETVTQLDVSDQSGHWQRAQAFLRIVQEFFDRAGEAPDNAARQRMVVERRIAAWRRDPPRHPVIVAGSTGSRGATALLMQAVAQLPQGAVVLPGFDFDLPPDVWETMGDALAAEDHPQFRYRRLMEALDAAPSDVLPWHDAPVSNPARNRLVSLALRPAPVTDQWLSEGPRLKDLAQATAGLTLLEAPSQRQEALAIALRLRQAAEDGTSAALITPDRALTRQVGAALDRWDILPDDSAGLPLQLSPPGRFLRHVSSLFRQDLSSELVLTLLKHPLTHSGEGRNRHLLLTRELELFLRKNSVPKPTAETLRAWITSRKEDAAPAWGRWLVDCFCDREDRAPRDLADRLQRHLDLAERIAAGHAGTGSGRLWEETAGRKAFEVVEALRQEAGLGGPIDAMDYADLFAAVLSREEVRDIAPAHPLIRIWGTLEARVQGADLVILGGLNEGSWPESPSPDPWLNRALRHRAGLLLPERRIGLAAHDFQQAIGAPEVWLTRAIRSDEAETVPSRWVNRLINLLGGLPEQGGDTALREMRKRGTVWLTRARQIEAPGQTPSAPRPAPCPPPEARPRRLSVTEIKRLIRDPYAIYARRVLRLEPLPPLDRAPDALLRGIVAHEVLERFVKRAMADPSLMTRDAFLAETVSVLEAKLPWAATRAIWQARLERVADWFLDTEAARQDLGKPAKFECKGAADLAGLDFTLTAKADRIDMGHDGRLHIYDYKTGAPPSKKQQRHFDKQLLLEAAMAERGAFEELDPAEVARAVYIGLGASPKELPAPLEDEPTSRVWAELHKLISHYSGPESGFPSRRAMERDDEPGDYDQLARFGEWEITDPPKKERLT